MADCAEVAAQRTMGKDVASRSSCYADIIWFSCWLSPCILPTHIRSDPQLYIINREIANDLISFPSIGTLSGIDSHFSSIVVGLFTFHELSEELYLNNQVSFWRNISWVFFSYTMTVHGRRRCCCQSSSLNDVVLPNQILVHWFSFYACHSVSIPHFLNFLYCIMLIQIRCSQGRIKTLLA